MGESAQVFRRVGFVAQCEQFGAVVQSDRFVVADGGHVHDGFEEVALGREEPVDGGRGDVRRRGDRLDARGRVAALDEQIVRRPDDTQASGPGAFVPTR